jgi:hypothetical protein
MICSIASTWAYKSSSVYAIPINSNTAFTQAAERIDEVPRPEPLGTFVTSECITKPLPRRSSISPRVCPSLEMIPQARRQAFCRAKGS